MITCMIIEDEPLARKGMLEYIAVVDFLQVTGVYENAKQAYPALEKQAAQLVFLDIELPGPSGIDLLRSLKTSPLVIFTTAYPDYAIEGYELDAIDYLLKPILPPRFLKAVNKAKEIIEWKKMDHVNDADHLFVKENGRYTKVLYKDILFVEALQNYVALHLQGKRLITYNTLSVLEKQLPATQFMRIHKSYIVSVDRIVAIEKNMVTLPNAVVPVSRNIKDELMKRLDNKLLKR